VGGGERRAIQLPVGYGPEKLLSPFKIPAFQHITVRTGIIENGARKPRISGFGMGGRNTARGFSFSPHLRYRPF